MITTLEYENYTASVSYDEADKVYVGKVADLNDLILFEGNSVEELKKAFEDTIKDYLHGR